MRIYCSMQFLESHRTSDQSDSKVERQQEAPAARSRSGKVKAFGRSRWDTLDLLCFRNLERGDISRLLNSYCADSAREDRTTDLITMTGSKTEINLRDLSHIGR